MKKPRPGVARRPRDLEKILGELVDQVNANKVAIEELKAEDAEAWAKAKVEFNETVKAKAKAEAKAKAKAKKEKETTNEKG